MSSEVLPDRATALAQPRIAASLPASLRLVVSSGPDRGRQLDLARGIFTIGKAEGCSLVLADPLVSRRHLELTIDETQIRLRDLASSNGSYFEGARFESITLGVGASFMIGESELRVVGGATVPSLPPSGAEAFGQLLGISVPMRQAFTILERVAASETAVLLQGETGVGKELAAEAIHRHSARRDAAFVVCDLSSVPRGGLESELFGHVRGAFAGAEQDRDGAFAQAQGGTLFLDEVGELDLELQPRLLRALERRQVKPVGASTYRSVDVRIVAATNRDLLAEVREGRFRRDLYHRLAVARIDLPPLRHRRDDIAFLATHFLGEAARALGRPAPKLSPELIALLGRHDWPGNARELRNVLEQAVSLSPEGQLAPGLLSLPVELEPGPGGALPSALPFKEARERLIEAWERDYLVALLEKAGHNISLAARRAGLSRVYLHELIKKHGFGRPT